MARSLPLPEHLMRQARLAQGLPAEGPPPEPPAPPLDKTGLTFGNLTVLSYDTSGRCSVSCDACGRVKSFYFGSLARRQNPTCGCVPVDKRVGRTIGQLTILAFEFGFYQCGCAACGEITPFMWHDLDRRRDPTCGCRPHEQRTRRQGLTRGSYHKPFQPEGMTVTTAVAESSRETDYRHPEIRTNGRLGDGNRMKPKGIREDYSPWRDDE